MSGARSAAIARLRDAFNAQAHHMGESNALITISLPATDWPILFLEVLAGRDTGPGAPR